MNRERQNRWDADNLVTICTKFPTREVVDIDRAIGEAGYQSRYAFIHDLVDTWMIQHHRRRTTGNMTTVKRLP